MSDRRGVEKVAGTGAVLAAALASMCCILPLGLGALGVSGAVLSAFFEPLRPYFLGLSGVLLAGGFYFSFRVPAEGRACSSGASTLSRAARPTLIVATLATAALALFPSLTGLAAAGGETLASEVSSEVVVLRVEGMTCASCAPAVRSHLLDVPGVIDAAVDYEKGRVEVRVRTERAPEAAELVGAVESAGYTGALEAR